MNHSRRAAEMAADMPDVQSSLDERQIVIDKVGVKALRHPLRVRTRKGDEQATVATVEMYVDLPAHSKGTHMSRFNALLNEYDAPLDLKGFGSLLAEMTARLEAHRGYIGLSFPYFVRKAAPVSGVESLMDYDVRIVGERAGDKNRFKLQVMVPVTSLCPCSRDISEYGAHNQRSHITLSVELRDDGLWIEDLIDLAEAEASCEVFGLLKRPDEKFVTERAYENPKFVEDAVRDLAVRLNADPRISAYTVECENFESIHNHSAYARIERSR